MFIFKKLFTVLFDGTDGGGTGAGTVTLPEWITTTFPEDARKDPTLAPLFTPDEKGNPPDLAKYKTPVDLLKSYKHGIEVMGKKGVIVPTEKSTPEEINKFWTDLGRPAKAEEYKLTLPEKLHPSIKIQPEGQKKFFEAAYKMGFTNQQANDLNAWYLSDMSASMFAQEKAQTEATQKADAELHTEWGANYDTYSAQAEKAFQVFGKDKLHPDSLKDANVKRMFQLIGSKISEDTFKAMTTTAGNEGNTDVKTQIETIMRDPKSAYNDASHPDHKKAVNDMLELHKKLPA